MCQRVKATMPWEVSDLDKYQIQCPVCGRVTDRNSWSISNMTVEQIYYCECGNILIVPPQETGEPESGYSKTVSEKKGCVQRHS